MRAASAGVDRRWLIATGYVNRQPWVRWAPRWWDAGPLVELFVRIVNEAEAAGRLVDEKPRRRAKSGLQQAIGGVVVG